MRPQRGSRVPMLTVGGENIARLLPVFLCHAQISSETAVKTCSMRERFHEHPSASGTGNEVTAPLFPAPCSDSPPYHLKAGDPSRGIAAPEESNCEIFSSSVSLATSAVAR